MFKSAKVMNPQGEILDLMGNRDRFVVSSIQGLNPPPATLNMSNIYGMDGARLNICYLNTRNIVITMMLRGDQEASRQELYRFLSSNAPLRFFFENNNRNVYIDGFVETNEDDQFVRKQEMQISIICPDPFFRDTAETVVELQNSRGEFTFPFAIDQGNPVEFGTYEANRTTDVINDTQTETPFEIEITAREVLGLFTEIIIQNQVTGEKIGFSGWPLAIDDGFIPGDVIYINTDPARPTMEIRRGTQVFNWVPRMIPGGTFFQLPPGSNVFAYKTQPAGHDYDNKIDISMKFRRMYRGV